MERSYTYEPPRMEVALTQIIGGFLLRGYYRGFVEGIDILESHKVLDWCAGSGFIARLVAKRLKSGALVFADVSQSWQALAAGKMKKQANARGVLLDGFDGLIAGGGYDRILVHFSLHDFPADRRAAIIRQLAANLKPGGVLSLREPVNRGGSHGIHLYDLLNLLESEKRLVYEYNAARHRLAGEFVDVRCRLKADIL